MPIPTTSTTLLRQMAADSRHVRWGEFVRRYQPMMEEYLRVHFPGSESEDIISETLIALVDVLKNYRYAPDETGSFHNYLTGILKHKALYRRRVAERNEKCRAAFEDSARRVGDPSSADEEREWKETVFAIAVRQLMSDETIQDRTKQVFLRVAINHESPDEVSTGDRNPVHGRIFRLPTLLWSRNVAGATLLGRGTAGGASSAAPQARFRPSVIPPSNLSPRPFAFAIGRSIRLS